VVVLEQLLAGLEVLQLDPLLRLADRARHPRMRDDLALLGAGAIHPAGDAVRAEQPHQVVLERQEEHALARVALAAGAAAQRAAGFPRGGPAWATISASRWWYLAFRTSCFKPRRLSMRDSVSDTSTLTVPTSTGRPRPCWRSTSSRIALYFSRRVL